ncbi:MAG TPA: ferritin-like domain-containing protein [Mycobacterium sp.]
MTSPHPTDTKQPKSAADKALADAIAAEHATIYGYGFVSAHSTPDLNDLVSDALAQHRARRDAAIQTLSSRGVAAPTAAVAYQLPIAVNNVHDAATLAVRMEDDDAVAWRAVLEQADSPTDRSSAITSLTQCATWAARWRHVLGEWPMTRPFPGGAE